MSLTSKVVFATCFITTTTIIGYVHYKQNSDRQKLHDGVIKDIELQKIRKVENTYNLQKQLDLTKLLKKELEETDKNI